MTRSERVRWMAPLLLALMPSCGPCRCSSEIDDVNTLDATPPAGTVNGSEEAPQPVLAAIWIPDAIHPHRPGVLQYGKRILADGTLWFHDDERYRVDSLTLKVEFDPVPLGWWFDGSRLTPRDIRILTDAIRRLGLMDLPTDPPPPEETLIGTSEVTWTFAIDGRPPHDVREFHGQPRPGLAEFQELFRRAVNNAGSRWSRDRGVPLGLAIEPLKEP